MNNKPPSYFKNPQFDSSPHYHQGGLVGVLLFHGYTATPVEVGLLAGFLSDRGYTVSCPLLPGHGTRIEDLNRSRWQDWVDYAELSYGELKQKCQQVFVGGESLGSLLSLTLGASHPEIKGLIINAPALYPLNKQAYLAPFMQYFIKTRAKKRAAPRKTIVDQRWQGYDIDAVPAVAQLIQLQRKVRKSLPEINQPIIIFQGRLDQTIDLRGASEVYDRVSSKDKQLIWLENTTHCVLLDQEWEDVTEKILVFIQRLSC